MIVLKNNQKRIDKSLNPDKLSINTKMNFPMTFPIVMLLCQARSGVFSVTDSLT